MVDQDTSTPTVSRAIPHPLPLYDVHGYSDASSKIGIASPSATDGEHGVSYPVAVLDGQRDIGWAEACRM